MLKKRRCIMPVFIKSEEDNRKSIPRVIILRGAPASGKTTVARKLASLIPTSKKALISIDDIQHLDLRRISRDKLRLGVYHTALLCRSFVQEGFDVVVEYVFDRDLDFFVEKLFKSHISTLAPCVVQIFFLDASLNVLMRRNKKRESSMRENVLRELFEACNKVKGKYHGEIVVDTNKLSVKKVATMILNEKKAIIELSKTGLILPEEKMEHCD
jgi:tRNA uridine 5-carbamoylmethylation protein Kti12